VTLPRRLVPGQLHTTTRRVIERRFLLKPTPEVNEIVLYCLGLALSRYPGVRLHATLVEANHKHDACSDASPESQLPDFYRTYHSLVARALNARYGRGENFWRTGSYDQVEVHGREALEDQLLYLWANPVQDGLVATPDEWPGVKFLPEDFGREITVARPEGAFFGGRRPAGWEPPEPLEQPPSRRGRGRHRGGVGRRGRPRERAPRPPQAERSSLPETVTFTVHPPPGYEHMALDEVRAHFRDLLDRHVAQVHEERRAAGLHGFMGVERILAQDPRESAGDTFPAFARNPRIACKDTEHRQGLLAELRAWRVRYREVLERWCAGRRRAVFPAGTYWLPRFHGARVARATGPPRAA